MTLVELAILLVADPVRLTSRVRVEGREHMARALAGSATGVIGLTAHLGNWELLGLATRELFHAPLAVIARPLDSTLLHRLSERLRARTGTEVIRKHRGFRAMAGALRRGSIVGILLDQNASRREGIFVPFFGQPASTSRGVAVLALRSGAPIVPVFIYREPDGSHRAVAEAPIQVATILDGESAIADITAECVRRIEGAIRRCPEQWFWLHRRWRTRPAPELATQ